MPIQVIPLFRDVLLAISPAIPKDIIIIVCSLFIKILFKLLLFELIMLLFGNEVYMQHVVCNWPWPAPGYVLMMLGKLLSTTVTPTHHAAI